MCAVSDNDREKPESTCPKHAVPLQVCYGNGVVKILCLVVERKDALTDSGNPLHKNKCVERVQIFVKKDNHYKNQNLSNNKPRNVKSGEKIDEKDGNRASDAKHDNEAADHFIACNQNVLYVGFARRHAYWNLFECERLLADLAVSAIGHGEPFKKTFFMHVRRGARTLAKGVTALFETDAACAHCAHCAWINTMRL